MLTWGLRTMRRRLNILNLPDRGKVAQPSLITLGPNRRTVIKEERTRKLGT